MSRKRKITIAYGVTGGRHPQMLGAAVALNEAFEKCEESDFEVLAHFGFSGGSIVAAIMGAGIHRVPGGPEEWIKESTKYGKYGKIGGFPNLICNVWNLFRHGGLLNSKKLHDKVFKNILGDLDVKTPAYAGSWCVSHNREILFDLKNCCPGIGIACSAALPFAISPMKVENSLLIERGHDDILEEIHDDKDGFSWFADAGISSSLGVGLVGDVPPVKDHELESGIPVPVIGVNIDPISPGHVSGFGKYTWYKKIWEACWGTIRANVLDDIRLAEDKRYLQLCEIPTPGNLMKFSTKFDASLSENLTLYNVGYRQAKEWLNTPLSSGEKPIQAMITWYEERESELDNLS